MSPPPGSSRSRHRDLDPDSPTDQQPHHPYPSDSPTSPIDVDTSNNNSTSASPTTNPNAPFPRPPSSTGRLSKDSEGYPSWLPKRPPPPAPASTFQSSILGGYGYAYGSTPSPVEGGDVDPEGAGAGAGAGSQPGVNFIGGRKPTPRSVRIVSLQDSFVGAVEKEARLSAHTTAGGPGPGPGIGGGGASREPTDQTQVSPNPNPNRDPSSGFPAPPKVWTRASGAPPTAFTSTEYDDVLPLPQPRFNAKQLHLQILRNPSGWMRAYFYAWPLLVFYHIPLQTFFDFNAVFMLLQVAKYPSPNTSGKNWALGAAAYIACWLAWIFVVCVVYELIYSFSRRWRLRRPLMLPIYLSSPAFNFAAMTSYTNFSFLQHLRISAFLPEHALALSPPMPIPPDADYDVDEVSNPEDDDLDLDNNFPGSGWKQGLAETCFFYSQNMPTVALLLPRAGLALALLFAFSSAPSAFVNSGGTSNLTKRDGTFFRQDGSGVLTDYARGVLIANAAWTGWRVLVLLLSWIGLWFFSAQRLGGLCGPRHTWEESAQEKTRSVYSEAASEYGAYRGSFYHTGGASGAPGYQGYRDGGDEAREYAGDELAWEWREATRMRVQDAFEFCLTTRRRSSSGGGGGRGTQGLRWSTASAVPYGHGNGHGYGYGQAARNRYRQRQRHSQSHHKRRSSATAKGKEPSNEKADEIDNNEPFEGIERVLAAVGFPTGASPARRGVLSKDLFAAPGPLSSSALDDRPMIEPLHFQQTKTQPTPSTSMFTGLEAPKMAKRNSKDKIPGSSTSAGAPLLSLPYPFSRPGAGQVSSKDLVPFPGGGGGGSRKSKSKSGESGSSEESSGSGSGSGEEEEEDVEDDEEVDDDDDEDEEEEEEEEDPSSGRASGSMSSLGQPISPSSRYPFGMRRPAGAGHGHGRSMSGVSSGLSSGAGMSGGSHAHSQGHSHTHSMSMSSQGGAVSVVTHSTGNQESTDSELRRERASLSQGSSNNGNGIPMPPRHPHPQGQGRGRSATVASSTGSSSAAAVALAGLNMHTTPVAFPSVHQRGRVDSGRGVVVDPAVLYGIGMGSDDDEDEDGIVVDDVDEGEEEEEEEFEEEAQGEQDDRVGLLGLPSSARNSRVSLTNSSSGDARSRTHSSFSSRSRHSSTRARSRTRTHSSSQHAPSVRERASSLGASMRSLMHGAASVSLTSLSQIAAGPGLGAFGGNSRPRSRVNSSMARLEEDVVFSPSATEMDERRRGASGTSSGSASGSGGSQADVGTSPRSQVARTRREVEAEAEGYSSGGTHSRSGSEAENYTFGRPLTFMRPPLTQEQQHDAVQEEEDEEVVLVQRLSGTAGRNSPARAGMDIPSVIRSTADDPQPGSAPQSISVSSISQSFYSPQPSERTASPPSGTPVPIHLYHPGSNDNFSLEHSPSPPQSTSEHSPERQGVSIPWSQSQSPSRFLVPPTAQTSSSGSPPDISTAAGSFVTAPATIDGATTTATESTLSLPSSWGTATGTGAIPMGTGRGGRRGEVGGMVERPGEDMGAAGGAWRVV